ncbi:MULTISPECIES: transporter substrate-binding domain-containing protein [Actinoplanes]|uniref:transporter substrate-binding domain-containing protein n=1 Tax=Actinoplanes TaxID=1865 RepID=UPI0005F2B5EB|nr:MULTISPECIES: transporter substrate-binding domain-containing protein [Actinoplanes]GLX99873.1 glutamate-binding protein [Actinoplanes sp. NBRC 101535]
MRRIFHWLPRIAAATVFLLMASLTVVAVVQQRRGTAASVSVDQLIRAAGLRPDRIRIAVFEDQPGLGYLENGRHAGFDVDIARMVARGLGYADDDRIEWHRMRNNIDRILMLKNDQADLVIGSFSITDERKRDVAFAGPYLITEQGVLASAEAGLTGVDDLRRPENRMCTVAGSTSERLLMTLGFPVTGLNGINECFDRLAAGDFVAISTDKTLLAGFDARDPSRYQLLDLPPGEDGQPAVQERIGIGIRKDNIALRTLVDHLLDRIYRQQQRGLTTDWQRAYNAHLAAATATSHQPPPDERPELLDYDSKGPTR